MPIDQDQGLKLAPTGRPCVICQRPAIVEFRPFCSTRCSDVDLQRWLTGAYAIPAEESDDPDQDSLNPTSARDTED